MNIISFIYGHLDNPILAQVWSELKAHPDAEGEELKRILAPALQEMERRENELTISLGGALPMSTAELAQII